MEMTSQSWVTEHGKGDQGIPVLSSFLWSPPSPFPNQDHLTQFSQVVLTQTLFCRITIFTCTLSSAMALGAYTIKIRTVVLLLIFNIFMCQPPKTFYFPAASKSKPKSKTGRDFQVCGHMGKDFQKQFCEGSDIIPHRTRLLLFSRPVVSDSL